MDKRIVFMISKGSVIIDKAIYLQREKNYI